MRIYDYGRWIRVAAVKRRFFRDIANFEKFINSLSKKELAEIWSISIVDNGAEGLFDNGVSFYDFHPLDKSSSLAVNLDIGDVKYIRIDIYRTGCKERENIEICHKNIIDLIKNSYL